MERMNTNPYAQFSANHTTAVQSFNCALEHPDILLPAPEEPDVDTDCRLDLADRGIFSYSYHNKVSAEALMRAGLSYLHNVRPFTQTKFIDSHIKAAARCFDLASRQFKYPDQLPQREENLARELKSLDKIDMQNTSDTERLALAHHKMGVLKAMGWFCSSSVDYHDYLNTRIYQEALTIARVYQRQAEDWLHKQMNKQTAGIRPKGHSPVPQPPQSVSLHAPALIQQANHLAVAAAHSSDMFQQIRLYTRALSILENVYKSDPMRCVEDPIFNFLNNEPSGFAWHGEFDENKTLLAYVTQRLNTLNSMTTENIPTQPGSSAWDNFTSIFTGPIRKLFGG